LLTQVSSHISDLISGLDHTHFTRTTAPFTRKSLVRFANQNLVYFSFTRFDTILV